MNQPNHALTSIQRGLETQTPNFVACGFFCFLAAIATLLLNSCSTPPKATAPGNARPPAGGTELRYWLENMARYHQFSTEEMSAATGLSSNEVVRSLRRYGLENAKPPTRSAEASLLVLPYPGGRHPRIGFLEGAIDPQRETKVSVFSPWAPASYVVVDVPEAIWSNLGLTYLAHTHIDTIWTKRHMTLPRLEWERRSDGTLEMTRTLPNNISFGTRVTPRRNAVVFDLWLRNGTPQTLRDLRIQTCVMLKAAAGFNQQTNSNKIFADPYAAVRADDGMHWIITAFEPCHRTWGNEQVPCLHSDPKFPDCAPGQTQRIRGWLSFYEGNDIREELKRLDAAGWRDS